MKASQKSKAKFKSFCAASGGLWRRLVSGGVKQGGGGSVKQSQARRRKGGFMRL
ncbi:hypothetical protein CUPS4244_09675 [Campylobacter upsaliensis]|uniref:hypothetical protein n=1 Tax=Campylobacter upsaliensis TaxID=28080 RepID=UPI00214A1FBD|nr:hypothetical protein [Campylobacter upsaliensis]MCR2105339.1 hypothetical protein [Campylobacter upsaliensis]